MEDSPPRVPSLAKLGKLANGKRFDELEAFWLSTIESGTYAAEHLIPIAGQVGRQGAPDRSEALFWTLLSATEARHGPGTALAAARLVARELPRAENLRKEISRLYLAVVPDFAELPGLLEKLDRDGLPLDETVQIADAYLRLRPGSFVLDPNFLDPGLVESIDPPTGLVTVRFAERRNDYGPATLDKLQSLPDDHFLSMILYKPDHLKSLATETPVDFLLLALKGSKDRRLGYRDLKLHVTRLLGEKGWQRWWKQTRSLLKRAPRIEASGGSQPTLRLLNQDRKYEDRLRKKFDSRSGPIGKLNLVLGFLDETKEAEPGTLEPAGTDLLVHFGNGAAKLAVANLNEHPEVSLAALAVHAEVAARGAEVARPNPSAAAKVLARLEDSGSLAQVLPEALLGRTLEYLRAVMPEKWPRVWAAVFPRAGRRTADSIARTLIDQGHGTELAAALDQVVQRPTSSAEALCWLWRAWQSPTLGKSLAGYGTVPAARIVTGLLVLADATGRLYAVSNEERHRKLLEMTRQTLALQDGAPVRSVFAAADKEAAARFKALLDSNGGLSALGRGQLLRLLRLEHEDLFVGDERPWEDDCIYTTRDGLNRRQGQLDYIITVDIPEVAKQIGEAAAFGDLSENAEFTAALEKRDQLTSRAARIENELKIARVIEEEMARSPFVNIGCRVRATDRESGVEESFTFLGPWDSDSDRNILSYDAPLAQAFMGKKVGEEVVFGEDESERRWQIRAIEPAI